MDNITQIRDLIGDSYKSGINKFEGDGVSTQFLIPKTSIKTDTVVLSGTTGGVTISDVDYTTGLVTLSTAIADGAIISLSYTFSAFRDQEIESYITLETSVNNTAIKLIKILMADAARRFDYSTGLENYKPSQVFDQLKKLKDDLSSDNSDLGSSGGVKIIKRTTVYGDLDQLYND